MAHADPETFSQHIRGLVRALSEIVQSMSIGKNFASGCSPDNMKAMRDMLRRAVQYRQKWRSLERFRLEKASKCMMPNWGGAILSGPWTPRDALDTPPPHLMPPVFPIPERRAKFEMINLIDELVEAQEENLTDNWKYGIWGRIVGRLRRRATSQHTIRGSSI